MNPHCNPFLVFDFETGGFSPTKNPAVEFAGIWIDPVEFKEICRYESIIKPFDPKLEITEGALKANGLTRDQINSGEDLNVVVDNIIKFSEMANKGRKAGKKTFLVGQNVLFDIGFLQQIFKYAKKDISKYFECKEDFFKNQIPASLDTLLMGRTKHASDDLKVKFGLRDLCIYENIDLINAHRAMNDVEATTDLFLQFMQGVRSGNNQVESSFRNNFTFQL